MQLEEFMNNPPPYAILSHTWEDGEVTYQDFTHPDRYIASTKKGFAKIQQTCQLAKQTDISYTWIDTCCIDKSSSSELTEAINSMFAWYAASEVCYAFLSDLGSTDAVDPLEPVPKLAACRWFSRGWTLQELIAPEVLEFYDKDWILRGTKDSLSKALEAITGIDNQVLRDNAVLTDIPVARRMSWAASRRTTRVEDIAYCLLGIFDVSMPMLYGEGERAFVRLQEEIAKEMNDLTLFAWQTKVPEVLKWGDTSVQKYRGILATSPAEFLEAGAIVAGDDARFNEEFLITNKGMRINSGFSRGPGGCCVLNLNCSLHGDPTKQIGIYLKQHGAGVYAREHPNKLILQSEWQFAKLDTIYISKRLTPSQSASLDKVHRHGFFFRKGLTKPEPFRAMIVHPANLWDAQRRLFLTRGVASFTGFITFSGPSELLDTRVFSEISSLDPLLMGKHFLVVCGITAGKEQKELRPWVAIGDADAQHELYQHLRDLKKLNEVGSRCNSKSIVISRRYVVSVEMEEAVVDGEPMYCVDLKVEHLTGPMGQQTVEEGPVVPRGNLAPVNYWTSTPQ